MQHRCGRWRFVIAFLVVSGACVRADIGPDEAALYLDFEKDDAQVTLHKGVRRIQGRFGGALEFTTVLRYADVQFSRALDGVEAMSIGGWFFPRRSGEQYFFCRGVPENGPQGERFFRPADDWVNLVLGTDQHGFLLGTVNGNGSMPFAHVTVNEVAFDAWNQLVVVKDRRGYHKFYLNGILVHTDEQAVWAGKETTVGLSGRTPGTPPAKNADFAVTMVEAGFVAFAADYPHG